MKSCLSIIICLFFLLCTIPVLGQAQSDSMTLMVKNAFHEKASMYTTFQREGKSQVRTYAVADFVKSIGEPHDVVYDERLGNYTLEIDEVLATMAVRYYFFLGESPSHCGTNFFTFFKSDDGWRIVSIADTRRKEPCDLPPFTW